MLLTHLFFCHKELQQLLFVADDSILCIVCNGSNLKPSTAIAVVCVITIQLL